MLNMFVYSLRLSQMNVQGLIVLREKDSDRYLPIWIGPAEAEAIRVKLQDAQVPRPMTHDLLCSTITAMGGSIQHILISDLQNETFYAKISIEVNGTVKEIDSRPSDALALALRAEAPIYATESVMDQAGVFMDEETGKPVPRESEESEPSAEVKEEELRRMSAFTEFINELDLDNFGQGQSGR